jgi:hypothetical protein
MPVTFTEVEVVTLPALAVNVADVAPCGTVIDAADSMTVLFALDSVTVVPPEGAGAVRTTVPVEVPPEGTVAGLKNSSFKSPVGGKMVSRVCCEELPIEAVMITFVVVGTGSVVTRKVALVAPTGTVTVGANCAALELLFSVTTAPPCGAALCSVTVPVAIPLPATEVGLTETLTTTGGGTTASVAVTVLEFAVAVSVTLTCEATATVVMVKEAVIAFWATVTVVPLGNCALGSLLARLIGSPPGGAALEIVSKPVTVPDGPGPPCTALALRTKPERVMALTGTTLTVVVTVPVVVPCRLAVRVTEVVALTLPPVRVKTWLDAPAGTVTAAAGSAAVLLLAICTICPPAGAGIFKETLHRTLFPTVTLACKQLIPARLIDGTISTVKKYSVVLSEAVSVTSVVFVTAVLMIVNCASVAPAGTVTLAGNVMGIGVDVGVAGFVNTADS